MSAFRMTRAASLPAALIAFLGVAGCQKKADNLPPADSSMDIAPAPPAPPEYTDAEIAHIALTANSIDSTAGAYALKKATNREVKDFARTMIRDHGAANKLTAQLTAKLTLTPQDNDESRALQDGHAQSQPGLDSLSGAAFDRAYIDQEVAYHQAVLGALDNTLIPQADDAELKALLQQIRPTVEQHLQRAQQIQGTLTPTS